MNDQPNTALKEIFDRARIEKFATDTKTVWDGFDEARFIEFATDGLDDLGIMQRMRRVAEAFDATLPADYGTAPFPQDGPATHAHCDEGVVNRRE